MIIFLYGSDRYRLFQNRDAVVAKFREKHGGALNVQAVDGATPTAVADLKAALGNNSFFNEMQLVIVQDIFSNPTVAGQIEELLERYDVRRDKQRIVVGVHGGSASSAKPPELFKVLSHKDNLVREFAPLAAGQFETWLKKEAHERGAPFAPGALRQFIVLAGTDTWNAINNLEKLVAYSRGPITLAAVNELVSTDAQSEIFVFIDALGRRDQGRALNLLHRELSLRQDPYYLLSMIIYQFRTLLMVRDAMERTNNSTIIATETGLKPFVVSKMKAAAARYKMEDLRRIYQTLCDLELGAKQGIHDLQDALYQFVLVKA